MDGNGPKQLVKMKGKFGFTVMGAYIAFVTKIKITVGIDPYNPDEDPYDPDCLGDDCPKPDPNGDGDPRRLPNIMTYASCEKIATFDEK